MSEYTHQILSEAWKCITNHMQGYYHQLKCQKYYTPYEKASVSRTTQVWGLSDLLDTWVRIHVVMWFKPLTMKFPSTFYTTSNSKFCSPIIVCIHKENDNWYSNWESHVELVAYVFWVLRIENEVMLVSIFIYSCGGCRNPCEMGYFYQFLRWLPKSLSLRTGPIFIRSCGVWRACVKWELRDQNSGITPGSLRRQLAAVT